MLKEKISLFIRITATITSFIILFFGISIYLEIIRVVIVISGSMLPTLPIDSIGILVPVDTQDIKIGDIILYDQPKLENVLHRVVDIEQINGEIELVMKGDNNSIIDTTVANKHNIKGKLLFNSTKVVMCIIVVTIVLWFLTMVIWIVYYS